MLYIQNILTMAIEIKPKSKPNHIELASLLLFARNQLHILHLQSLSYSQHIAISESYNTVSNIVDNFIEVIQGKEGMILKGYKSFPYSEQEPITYITSVITGINSYRKLLTPEYDEIDNMLQETVASLEKTIYKLKFLK